MDWQGDQCIDCTALQSMQGPLEAGLSSQTLHGSSKDGEALWRVCNNNGYMVHK